MVNALSFATSLDKLPPHDIDVEEAILGAILFDPQVIHKVKDSIPPDAFYLEVHQDIYRAALNLSKNDVAVQMMSVTSYLEQRGFLRRVGGRSKLIHLISITVTSTLIEDHAKLLLDFYLRRKVIQLGHELAERGHDAYINIADLLKLAEEKTGSVIRNDYGLGGDDRDKSLRDRIVKGVRHIELNVLDPALKLIKMGRLANELHYPQRFIEDVYFKALLSEQNEPMMSFAEFKEMYGKEIREWLLGGFLPKGKVVLLYARGGVGKTRLAYELGLHLANGQPWSGFPVNGKYRLLYVQTDESPNDTINALEARGYDDSMPLMIKSKWTMDHIPALKQDIIDHQANYVIIDSVTSANSGSTFSQNDVEYSRPILKLRDLAQETGATIVLIHHASKAGEARGTSAIFDSVSEVWKLDKDNSPGAVETDRLLTIEKSRSRAPATYRLNFDRDEKSWICLGKQSEEVVSDAVTCKDKIVSFLANNRGVAYQVDEIHHQLGGAKDNIRKHLCQLADDGVIYRRDTIPKKGHPARYYLPRFWGDAEDTPPCSNNSQHSTQKSESVFPLGGSEFYPSTTMVSKNADPGIKITGSEFYPSTTGITAYSDPVSEIFSDRATTLANEKNAHTGSEYAETIVVDSQNSDPVSDPSFEADQNFSSVVIQKNGENSDPVSDPSPLIEGANFETLVVDRQNSDPVSDPSPLNSTELLPDPVKVIYNSPLGQIKAIAQPITINNWKFSLMLSDSTGLVLTQESKTTAKKAANKLKEIKDDWIKSLAFRVYRMEASGYNWVENCRCIKINPHHNPKAIAFIFQCPDGEIVQKLAKNSDEFEVVGGKYPNAGNG